MQLTRFDRWLREKFVYETHIHTMRPPEPLPAGIRSLPQPANPTGNYPFHFVARSRTAADTLIRQLKDNGQMYATRIVDRPSWFVPLIAPKDKSLTWRLVTLAMLATSAYYVLHFLQGLIDSPVFRKNFLDALKILQG